MKPTVRNQKNEIKELAWRWLTPTDLPRIHRLNAVIGEHLEDKSWYQEDEDEDFLRAMAEGTGCIGGFVEEELICMRFVSYPAETNLAKNIIDAKYWDGVLHLETTLVHPDYRGNALQVRSFYYLLAHLPGHVRYLFNTVSPYNLPSLKSTFKYDSMVVDLRCLYPSPEDPDGVLRYVGVRGLVEELDPAVVKVAGDDIERQRELFRAGYVGTGLSEDQWVHFQKVLRTAVPMLTIKA